jgi:hypothetical protein
MAYAFISNTKYLILPINVSNRAGGAFDEEVIPI